MQLTKKIIREFVKMKWLYFVGVLSFATVVYGIGHTVRSSHTYRAAASASNGDHVEMVTKVRQKHRVVSGGSTGGYGKAKAKTRHSASGSYGSVGK